MKKLLFIRFYCDLALVVAICLVFYPLDYSYMYTLDPVFYIKVGAAVAAAYLFIGGLMAFTCLLVQKGEAKLPSHKVQAALFNMELCILVGVLIASITLDNEPLIENVALPFMIIFVVLSVFLLRTVRDLGNITAERRNYAISAVILIVTLLLTNAIRQVIARFVFNVIPDIKYVIKKLAPIRFGGAPTREKHEKEHTVLTIKRPDVIKIILITLAIIIALVLLILFIRLIMRNYRNLKRRQTYAKDHSLYDETRVFIKSGPKDSTAKRKASISRDYRATVRACYAKFMQLCKKWEVDIRSSDTTRQINNKYDQKFPSQATESLRDLYLEARYSNSAVGQQAAEQSVQAYKALKKQVGQS